MLIRVYEPNGKQYRKDIDGSLESMHDIVDGYIEPVSIGDSLVIICDEEGKLKHKKPCALIVDRDANKLLDVVVGTFFVCAEDGEDLTGLDTKHDMIAFTLIAPNPYNEPPFIVFI